MSEAETKGSPWIAGVEPPLELRNKTMIEIYEMECREQPDRLAGLLSAYQENSSIRYELDRFSQMARSHGPFLFMGMGASYCSSIAGAVHLQSHGRSAFAVDASEWLHYSEAWDRAAVSLLVTTSGESAELVKLCQKGAHTPVGLLCNNDKSACWSLMKHKLPILAGPEYGNATKTYTNSTAACIVLASHVLGRTWQNDVDRVLQSFAASLEMAFSRKNEMEEFCRGAANIEIIGRGAAYGGAIMGALCIREMTANRAAPHSGGGFRHGPILDVNSSHVVMILALGRTASLGVTLAEDCLKRGGKVILVETEERAASERLLPVRIAAVPEPWEAITSVTVPQALTLAIAERYGANLKPRFHYGEMKE